MKSELGEKNDFKNYYFNIIISEKLEKEEEERKKLPVTGHHGKAADAVGVWGGSDSPRHRYKGVAAMEKVTLPGQHTDSLLGVEGVELTGLLLSTSLPTRFYIPLTLFNDRTSSQATRRVLGIAGTDGRDQRGKCWRN